MEEQQERQSRVNRILADINESKIDSGQWQHYMDTLEQFECWQPLFRILTQKIAVSDKGEIADYTRLARIHTLYLEDVKSGAKACLKLMQNFPMDYKSFRERVFQEVIKEGDYEYEAAILEAIYDELKSNAEKIECLERLCLIYEKKRYNEKKLNEAFENLLTLDPANVKALRFFKAIFTQSQDWENVVGILKTLYGSSTHKNDAYRIAQELATVYLFQLDKPESCLDILNSYCQGSPLDTSSLYYEAFYRSRDWKGCLDILDKFLKKVESDKSKAVIFLKMGELFELMADSDNAISCYEKSFFMKKNLLEPIENLIEIYIDLKNWPQVIRWLNAMRDTTDKYDLKERLDEAIKRITDCTG